MQTKSDGVVVHWSNHALQRMMERRPKQDFAIPTKEIVRAVKTLNSTVKFRLRYQGLCYIVQAEPSRCTIITVVRDTKGRKSSS